MAEPKTHINEVLHTNFINSGRAAGEGITYDRYDDESGYRPGVRERGRVRLPHDSMTREQWEALNGEVRIIRNGGDK